ncbi:hypothetical protein C0992_001789 [Termitomyces sp. T32_za158]|nr:hypothetical protein C0992_001789 [Termitomyces sp. T32_za158]
MAKRVVAENPVNAVRLPFSGTSKLALPSSTLPSRASMLASVVPMLRKQVDGIQKTPLLTLKLSSPSFLDATVTDDNVTEQPLYTVTTVGPITTIKRADPWDGDTITAEIRWSRIVPQKAKNSDGVFVQMRGSRWERIETFLRRGSGRKFNIPNYAQSLKWKQRDNIYLCKTAAVKGPIATLDLAGDLSTPQFQIFETLHDKNNARPMLVHHGVSILLLDYLLVTALVLVTDPQEWMKLQVADIPGRDVTDFPPLASLQPLASNFSTSQEQWRKIMYGEPMYPTRTRNSSRSSPSSSFEALTQTCQPPEQLIAYRHSRYKRSSSPTPSSSESEGVSEHVYFSPPTTRSQSPASESIFSPVSRGAAPSHTYLDPSYYNANDHVPPVPPIPAHLVANSHSPQIRPSTSDSTANSARRLPDIPVLLPVPALIPRPRSTPPRPRTSPSVNFPANAASGSPIPVSGPSVTSPLRPHRQLPLPPQASTRLHPDDRELPSGRVRTRSASQSRAMREREKWLPHATYHQRTLPIPPTSSSQGDVQRAPLHIQHVVSEDGQLVVNKEGDGHLGHWGGEAGPGAAYDMPPPAYNSINFSPRVSHSPLQGPASPLS